MGCIQSSAGIAFYHGKCEDIEHRIIGKEKTIFIILIVPVTDRHPSYFAKSDSIDNLRIIFDEIVGHRRTGFGNIEVIPGDFQFRPQSIDPFGFIMEFVVAQLVEHICGDTDTARHANSQTQDIDQGKSFVFFDIDKGDFQIVLEHFDLLAG
jgi:hypothetical protein